MLAALGRAWQALAAAPPRPKTRVGEVGSGQSVTGGIPDIDYLNELAFPQYIDEFKRLANHPQTAQVLRANTYPLLNADWTVEPASDDRRDELIAEFVGANLYQQEGETFGASFWSETPWSDRLRDVLRFLQNGFALFQVIYRNEGRFTVVQKHKYILPESILRWKFDVQDRWIGVVRSYVGMDGEAVTEEELSADNLVIYTWDREGSNILGKPLIRPAWKPFQFVSRLEKLLVIDKQKTAIGVPYFKNPRDASPEDITRGEQVVKAMRSGNYERLYVALTEGQDFGWKEGGIYTKALPEGINLFNSDISKVGGMEFTGLAHGQDSGGGRGVAGTQASFSALLLSSIAGVVIAFERLGIRTQVDMNFQGVRRYPALKVANIDPFEKTRILPAIAESIASGAITNTLDTENELRRGYKLMEIDEEERQKARTVAWPAFDPHGGVARPRSGVGDGGDGPEGRTATGGEGAPSPATQGRRRVRLQEGDDDPVLRARVDAGAIRRELERLESVYFATLRSVQKDMREAVLQQVREGNLKPRRAAEVKVPFQDELKDRLVAIAKSVRDYGREQVTAEVNRQLQALRKAATPDPSSRRGAISYSNMQAEVVAELDATALVQRLQSQVTAQYTALVGAGLEAPDIAARIDAYLGGLSSRAIEDMARSSTSMVFNAGRNVAIVELRPQLQPDAIRVEVLDDNTCEPCGKPASEGGLNLLRVRIGSTEYLENQPPRGCEGAARCRGFYVVNARL